MKKLSKLFIVALFALSLTLSLAACGRGSTDDPTGLTLNRQAEIAKNTYINIIDVNNSKVETSHAAFTQTTISKVKLLDKELYREKQSKNTINSTTSIFEYFLEKYEFDYYTDYSQTGSELGLFWFYIFSTTSLSLIEEYGTNALIYNYQLEYDGINGRLPYAGWISDKANLVGVKEKDGQYDVYSTFMSNYGRTSHCKTYYNSNDDYGFENLEIHASEGLVRNYFYYSYDRANDMCVYVAPAELNKDLNFTNFKLTIDFYSIGVTYNQYFGEIFTGNGEGISIQDEDMALINNFFKEKLTELTEISEAIEDENIDKAENGADDWLNIDEGKKKKNMYPDAHIVDFDYDLYNKFYNEQSRRTN